MVLGEISSSNGVLDCLGSSTGHESRMLVDTVWSCPKAIAIARPRSISLSSQDPEV